MNNGIEKIGIFKIKSEPYLKPISDIGIGFYNLDENTATLRFQLNNTSSGKPYCTSPPFHPLGE